MLYLKSVQICVIVAISVTCYFVFRNDINAKIENIKKTRRRICKRQEMINELETINRMIDDAYDSFRKNEEYTTKFKSINEKILRLNKKVCKHKKLFDENELKLFKILSDCLKKEI